MDMNTRYIGWFVNNVMEKIGKYIQKNKNIWLSCIMIFMIYRIFISLWSFYIQYHFPAKLLPQDIELYEIIINSSINKQNNFYKYIIFPWFRLDGIWYMKIAVNGFINNSQAFAPVYPLLIVFISRLFNINYLLSGLLISNISLLLSIIIIFQEVSELFGDKSAKQTIIFLLSFPTAFYFISLYSESLFLLFLLLLWKSINYQNWIKTSLFGALVILTRFQGILIILPILYFYFLSHKKGRLLDLFSIILMILVFPLWSIYLHYFRELDFPWIALNKGWESKFTIPYLVLFNDINILIKNKNIIYYYSYFLDMIVLCIITVLLIFVIKKLQQKYILFIFPLIILPLIKTDKNYTSVSLSRYMLPIFPIYYILGNFIKFRFLEYIILFVFLLLQLISITIFINGDWVA